MGKPPNRPPPSEIQKPADNQHIGGQRTKPPSVIILHATAGTDSINWLTTTSNPPVSIHALIQKDGDIYRMVADDRIAWHAGFAFIGPYAPRGPVGSVNNISLGIEIENLNNGTDPYPDPQIDSTGFVIAGWWRTYGPLPILAHSLVDKRKSDPAGLDWAALYRAIYRWWL